MIMITCDKCGTKLPENAEFCAYCGSEIKKTVNTSSKRKNISYLHMYFSIH
ncbi:hypothetical protein B6U54_00255 [Ligilactobacillus salivarius]|uniref:zinc-ribbon domain-containing protein n=1 Tax=Ligilactobacillus salivarius TaxID=1624 RepID=UPI0009D93B81|nr:hypothetical protein B6U54_00255 [Ligilactobacillus salivarius]